MTVSSIKVKIVRKPTLKIKTLVKFPANVLSSNFLTITKSNGTYTFGVDYTLLGPGPISNPTTAIIAILDQTAGVYKEVSLSSLLTSGLDADLQAIAALTTTGILARTASNTWALRTVTGTANEITVTNGDGVAGAPTLSLPAALTFTGKTITGGTYTGVVSFNGNIWTAGTGTLTLGAGKTATISNTLTFTGTDSSSVAFGAGGTVLYNGGALGTPSSATLTNATGLPLSGHTTQGAYTIVANATGSTAVPTAMDVTALTSKASPVSGDIVLIQDSAASNAFKKTTVGALASAGSVASIAGNTGAFTLTKGITNSTNAIGLSLTNAALQTTAVSPVASTTPAGVMMGLGGTCTLTPTYSGRIKLDFQFNIANSSASSSNFVTMRFGTGTAPLNGAAVLGTQVGSSLNYQPQASAWIIPVTTTGIILSLTPGTAYWFDLTLGPSTGTATISSVTCNAFEF